MTRMAGPDCAVIMGNLINTHKHKELYKQRQCVPFVASDQRFS